MSFLRDMLDTIVERGRSLRDGNLWSSTIGLARRKPAADPVVALEQSCRALLSGRGEASGVAIAREILAQYGALSETDKLAFFRRLDVAFATDQAKLEAAWAEHQKNRTERAFRKLLHAVEPPRQELIRRLNRAPGATPALVAMRAEVMEAARKEPALVSVDEDLAHMLNSWFNEGFLVLRRISWSTPADILERIARYEAVHTVQGWEDLRRRVQPSDRRLYAFFHPSLGDDPLIFVEIALTTEIPSSIQNLLADQRNEVPAEQATCAIFYSISNCQPGLRGISLGNFLIKTVVEELARDLPNLKTYVTLSPSPNFGRWLQQVIKKPALAGIKDLNVASLERLATPGWHTDRAFVESVRPLILTLAATYYMQAKTDSGKPLDSVARFHLGNGARLERLNWLGDTSPKGLAEGAGLMVNYLYDLRTIEVNHEAFANDGTVVVSPAIQREVREQSVKAWRGNA